jgi:hypothetical protein
VRHPDGRNVDRGPQVESEPGPSGVISAARVHQEDVGHAGKLSNCRLEQRSLTHRERAGPIAGGRSDGDDSIDRPRSEGDRRGPGRLARMVARRTGRSHEPHTADRLRVTSRPGDRTASRTAANCCISAVEAALPSSAMILDGSSHTARSRCDALMPGDSARWPVRYQDVVRLQECLAASSPLAWTPSNGAIAIAQPPPPPVHPPGIQCQTTAYLAPKSAYANLALHRIAAEPCPSRLPHLYDDVNGSAPRWSRERPGNVG